MKTKRYLLLLCLAAVLLVFRGAFASAEAGDGGFEVTVTNLTRGQIISPPVVYTHNRKLEPLFKPGSPASAELAAIAEDAVNDPLIDSLSGNPNVKDVQTLFGAGGPILPGESASVEVGAGGHFRFVTVVAMLVSTNDAFFALNGVRGPGHGSSMHRSPAYDAGSEANNEDCAFIPGPPCGNAGVRDGAGAEGYVHIHAGIHGIGPQGGPSIVPEEHDWRNPVARIEIRRLAGGDDDD